MIPSDLNGDVKKIRLVLQDRIETWHRWTKRNQRLLNLAINFGFRRGRDQFYIARVASGNKQGQARVEYQWMKYQDHAFHETDGSRVVMADWSLYMFQQWEYLFDRIKANLEKYLQNKTDRLAQRFQPGDLTIGDYQRRES